MPCLQGRKFFRSLLRRFVGGFSCQEPLRDTVPFGSFLSRLSGIFDDFLLRLLGGAADLNCVGWG
jgi:hypothetical protein